MTQSRAGSETHAELTPFSVGDRLIDPMGLTIVREGRAVRVEPKVMSVLTCLAAHAGRTVTREELERTVWTGTVVGYDALGNAIIKLRKALGDSARDPRLIETIPRIGYRLIAPVRFAAAHEPDRAAAGETHGDDVGPQPVRPSAAADADAEDARAPAGPRTGRWQRHAALAVAGLTVAAGTAWWLARWPPDPTVRPAAEEPSIAVLPFANLSGDPAHEYFADGITDDLTTELARIPGLVVISRGSAFTFKDEAPAPEHVAEALGVRYLLQGSVQRSQERLRINATLIDTDTGAHLWGDRYDGATDDVFALQDRIAARIVDALALELGPHRNGPPAGARTASPAAHDAYLLGLGAYYRRTPTDNSLAAEHLEQAINLDPGYSAAYTTLAKVYARAMVHDQAYADALGIFWSDGYTRARGLLARGMMEAGPDVYVMRSWLALRKHQHASAIAEAEQAVALSPNDADALEALAEALIFAGRAGEGAGFAREAIRRNPALLSRPLYLLGLAAFATGDPRAAVDYVERAMDHAPAGEGELSALLAAARGELGQTALAEDAFRAFADSFLNRPDRAWSVRTLSFANPRFHTWQRIDLAWAVFSFPFADPAVLERFAAGLAAAGAPAGVAGYLPLHRDNRLAGEEIAKLLLGRTVGGTDFWLSEHAWRQRRSAGGRVEHSGYPIHPGLPDPASGRGRMDGDRLCERWPPLGADFDVCVALFRVPEGAARARWGDYVMVTDTGPHPFSVR